MKNFSRCLILSMLTLLLSSCVTLYDQLPTRSGVPLRSVEVLGGGTTLWRIETADPRPVLDLRYGVVPTEFTQVFPLSRPPRLLTSGEPLQLKYEYVDNSITVEATAVGISGVKQTASHSSAPPH